MRKLALTSVLAVLSLAGLTAAPAMATVTQNIPQTNISAGSTTFNVNPAAQTWSVADVIINRTGAGNHPWLNKLTAADTLGIDIQYSLDGGTTWIDCGTYTAVGGTYVVKGVTLSTDEFSVSPVGGGTFSSGTQFRVILVASTATTISGTVTYA